MKNKYRIYYYILSLVVLIVFVALYRVVRVKDISLDKLSQIVESNTDVTVMDKGDDNKLKKLYYLNPKDIDSYVLYSPKSNMDANEILMVRVKNEKDMDEIKAKVQERIDKQSNSFKEYRPEEYETIKSCYYKQQGLNLILIISKDSDKLASEINNLYR